MGGNVMVIVPEEDDLFDDAVEPMLGIACTSSVHKPIRFRRDQRSCQSRLML